MTTETQALTCPDSEAEAELMGTALDPAFTTPLPKPAPDPTVPAKDERTNHDDADQT